MSKNEAIKELVDYFQPDAHGFKKIKSVINLIELTVHKFEPVQMQKTSIETIRQVVADYFQLQVSDLIGKSRKREIVNARHIAMWICCKQGFSLKTTGAWFGCRDHTTVINAKKKVKDLCETEEEFCRDVNILEKKFIN